MLDMRLPGIDFNITSFIFLLLLLHLAHLISTCNKMRLTNKRKHSLVRPVFRSCNHRSLLLTPLFSPYPLDEPLVDFAYA